MDHNQASLLDYQVVANVLETNVSTGLTPLEARQRLAKYGPNKLNDEIDKSGSVKRLIHENVLQFLRQFLNPLIQLLFICVIISAVIGEWENSLSVMVSIVTVCSISYVQERRADKSLEKLNKQMPTKCKVIRANQAQELEAQQLVPGDIIHLSEGQRVPADVRLFELHSLTVNEANLTGETQSQLKTGQPMGKQIKSALSRGLSRTATSATTITFNQEQQEGDDDPLQQQMFMFQNLALMGTLVESGHSKAIVICTGKSTRYGEVFSLLKATQQPRSPLQTNIDQLSHHLVITACVIIALVAIVGIVQKRPPLQVIYYALSLAVTAIPEGLPVVVAVIMTLGVIRLSKQKTIVKSLNSIETLGCVQVLCADKTGTLTRNDMTLTDVVTSELHSLSSGDLEQLHTDEHQAMEQITTFNKLGGKMYSIGRLMEVGTLCNNATVELDANDGKPTGRLVGQATECAILQASIKLGFGDSRTKFKRLGEIPFTASSRRMVVQCQRQDLASSSPMFYVKGAWEDILRDCEHYYECGLVKSKTEEMWLEYERICTTLGSQGLRVLALALGASLDELTFVGLIGIKNALREGMVETIDKLRNEFHLDIKMITGDSRSTAVAVGRSLGLFDSSESGCSGSRDQQQQQQQESDVDQFCMSGEQLQRLFSQDVDQASKAHELLNKCLFYRVDPIQKANIVSKLQELNKIVAMTGDGVNDVISLKRSNLSLVMGSGADVCKEIADVIIVDDDLAVLLEAVIEGKGIYHKIHSFLAYQVSISFTLVLLVGLSFAVQCDPPFTVIQLLFINLLADGPPAQSLAMERINANELCLWPRDVNDPLLSCRLLGSILVLSSTLLILNGSLYYFLLGSESSSSGSSTPASPLDFTRIDAHARSLLFICFIYCSIFTALSLRSKFKTTFETRIHGNKALLYCCSVVILISILMCQISGLNGFFDIEWLPYSEFLYVFLYSSLVLIIMDSLKLLVRLLDYIRRSMIKAAIHSMA